MRYNVGDIVYNFIDDFEYNMMPCAFHFVRYADEEKFNIIGNPGSLDMYSQVDGTSLNDSSVIKKFYHGVLDKKKIDNKIEEFKKNLIMRMERDTAREKFRLKNEIHRLQGILNSYGGKKNVLYDVSRCNSITEDEVLNRIDLLIKNGVDCTKTEWLEWKKVREEIEKKKS